MNCEEASELLSAYALGVLDRDELDALESHLRECREHDNELIELRATVFALDRHGEPEAPAASAALATRVRALVEPPRLHEVVAMPSVAPRRRAIPLWAGAIAAAVALLLVFGAGWIAGRSFDSDGEAFAYLVQGADGQVVEIAGRAESDSVTVTMVNIDRLPPDSAYQLWAVREDGWVPIGTCNTNENGWWRGDFAFNYERGEAIALTVEPAGGSDIPTSEPVLKGEF